MKFADFQEELKNRKYHPAYFFAGEEACLIDDGVAALVGVLVTPESRDFNFDLFYGSDVAASRVIEIASSFPMLAAHRTIVVREVQKMPAADLAAIAAYTAKPNRSTYLILTATDKDLRKKALETLRARSCWVECKPLYDNQVPGWIQREAKRYGLTISEAVAQWMASEVGNNLLHVRSELEKLQLFIGERTEIREDDVAAVTGSRREFTIYALQDAVGEKNVALALKILDRLSQQRTNAASILYGLSRYFGNLYMAHGFGRSRDDMQKLASAARMSSYFVPQLWRAAERYSLPEITHALEILRLGDYALKRRPLPDLLTLRLSLIAIIQHLPVRYLPFGVARQ